MPLSALRTESSPVVGEFSSLIEFADFIAKTKLSVIQLLPVLDTGMQSSPYSSLSAFALHPMHITLSQLALFNKCYETDSVFKKTYDELLSHKTDERFDYEYIVRTKDSLLRKIWNATIYTGDKAVSDLEQDFYHFIDENAEWLPFYCVYKNFKHTYNQASWKSWGKEHKGLSKEAILKLWGEKSLETELRFYAWEQYAAHRQFKKATDYVKSLGITLKGDLPILLNEDSCDVWACPEVFNQKAKAGSPPDGDNPTGQNWGFPCYDFVQQEKDNFAWWRLRIKCAAQYFGAYRLDHIPGFFRLWTIPDGEYTAEMGHTEPFSPISESQLIKSGFSKERIRWLSQPHVPTEDFIRLVGNPDTTREILGTLCDRIGWEELWLFKPSVKTEADLRKINLDKYNIDSSIQVEIFNRLSYWWKNRTLVEVGRNKFVPLWKYYETRAWNTLSQDERNTLSWLFSENERKQDGLWEAQAEKIFSALISESDMTPCGEDLGVVIPCMERVLDKFGIFGLKVIRWCREWDKPNQPYIDIHSYRHLSIVTTSVHDSSTMREWFNSENAYSGRTLDADTAKAVLENYAQTSGAWFINPLQDWLYLDQSYYAADPKSERINVPGSVTNFNWTWRMPVEIEKLSANSQLIERIAGIVAIHDKQ